jgi:hypothetical protein
MRQKQHKKNCCFFGFTGRQWETKPGERETPKELMTADTKIGQIEARLQNQKPDLDHQAEK